MDIPIAEAQRPEPNGTVHSKVVPQCHAGNPRVLARFDQVDEELRCQAEMTAEMEFLPGTEAKREPRDGCDNASYRLL